MQTNQRCTQCLLPLSYPGLRLSPEGICQFCLGTEPEFEYEKKTKTDLDRLIASVKGQSGKYDAIVGVSGGKDSTYVAYYLQKEYGLKILGVNYDIGYRSEYALRNLDTLVNRLDIDLVTLRPNPGFLHRLFANFLRKRGEFCSVCNNLGYLIIASFAFQQSQLLGCAPLVVGGWSKQYEFQPGVSVTNMKYFFSHLDDDLVQELYAQPFIDKNVVKVFRKVGDPRQALVGTEANRQMGAFALRGIQLPDYIEWNVLEFPAILKRELGWQQPPNMHDSHFDCTLFPIKEYLKHRKYGLTQETIKNSRLIREGLMTREEGLQRTEMEQSTEPEELAPFLKNADVDREDINWDGDWSTK